MVSVGHPAELSCNISSKGYLTQPAISWVHNGADIAPSGGTSKYYLPQPHVLRVNQASRSDSGVYQCIVRNPSTGIEVQASAEIIVQGTDHQVRYLMNAAELGNFFSLLVLLI